MTIEKIRTISLSFIYDDGYGREYEVEAEVECDAPDSYTMTHASGPGVDDCSDHVFSCIKEKAEELAWKRDNEPRNSRLGCQCPAIGVTLADMIHERDCPLRLRGEERDAFNDLLRKEKRESYRMSAADLDYEQAHAHDSTWVYLNLK